MDSSLKSSLLQDDASVRARNKILITLVFALIISVALIIGGIIVSFLLSYDSNSHSQSSPAVEEFCAASESELRCIASLTSSVRTTRHADPTRVYTLSLEAALRKLSYVDSIVSRSNSVDTRIDPALKNCWSSLRGAARGIDATLVVMQVNQNIETQAFEQRRSMVLLIEKAMDALRSCGKDLETGSTVVHEAGARVQEVEVLLRNSRDFLVNFQGVKGNFKANYDYWSTRMILQDVADVSLFGLQYLVLIFLLCLLFRKYNK